jgi:hypothetical protein
MLMSALSLAAWFRSSHSSTPGKVTNRHTALETAMYSEVAGRPEDIWALRLAAWNIGRSASCPPALAV